MTPEQIELVKHLTLAQIDERQVINKSIRSKFGDRPLMVNLDSECKQRDREIEALEAMLALVLG